MHEQQQVWQSSMCSNLTAQCWDGFANIINNVKCDQCLHTSWSNGSEAMETAKRSAGADVALEVNLRNQLCASHEECSEGIHTLQGKSKQWRREGNTRYSDREGNLLISPTPRHCDCFCRIQFWNKCQYEYRVESCIGSCFRASSRIFPVLCMLFSHDFNLVLYVNSAILKNTQHLFQKVWENLQCQL